MRTVPHGKHLIAGEWVTSDAGVAALVDRAARAAETAFVTFGRTSRTVRAALLTAIADQIEARADAITETGCAETGLPPARLQGERGRTTGQLRLFAAHILQGDYLDRRHDRALPDRQPLPRPDLRMIQRPIGPVAVFGASNFPLAFSTAGGDTASALAAGCPVVVKGHPAHPGTSEIVAEAILAALRATGLPGGTFSLVQGDGPETGGALVTHPLIRAVGFTGGLRGGRALFDLCARRPEPIPFFGELGSVNPVFVLPAALAARAEAMAQGWAASLTMGAGQFCTNPGVLILSEGPGAQVFADTALAALIATAPQVMLTDGIAKAFAEGARAMAHVAGPLLPGQVQDRRATPALMTATTEKFLANPALAHEVFGPLGLIVTTRDAGERAALAVALEGQLTATLQMDAADTDEARALLPVLERKAGRILVNGWPTGVEVADAMVHGGPYPASTNFGATSVGTLSIRRWLRPVCYQNLPDALQDPDLAA